jgi:methylenetetrahydrofolate dehydrogenase (NADP+)/methenyltetrahydrofolate cyclohydrolase
MKLINGREIARRREERLKRQVAGLIRQGILPQLGIIVLADDAAGQVYTRLKAAAAARLGIKVAVSNTAAVLDQWNQDKAIHGILIQRPGWRGEEFESYWNNLVAGIHPAKDVDGLRPDSKFTPATVRAVEIILKTVNARRQSFLIVGRGLVGRSVAKRLKAANISSRDPKLAAKVLRADVLITACGRPGLIQAVKPQAVVIDCGWPKGDVDLAAVKDTVGAITPVPGGVGPITVVCLLENLLEAVYNRL